MMPIACLLWEDFYVLYFLGHSSHSNWEVQTFTRSLYSNVFMFKHYLHFADWYTFSLVKNYFLHIQGHSSHINRGRWTFYSTVFIFNQCVFILFLFSYIYKGSVSSFFVYSQITPLRITKEWQTDFYIITYMRDRSYQSSLAPITHLNLRFCVKRPQYGILCR